MKYFISEPWFFIRELFISKKGVQEELNKIHKQGYVVFKNFLNKEKCSFLIEEFEKNISNPKVWKDAIGSDTRLHGIERKVSEFSTVFGDDKLIKIYNNYIHSSMKSMVLCNHIKPVESNLGSGGGWHRDSINRRQLKFILYLTDAKRENGCFQYMPKSHWLSNKYKINKVLGKGSGEYRYSEADISTLITSSREFNVIDIEGKAGDLIVVDTSGIHRGAPIVQGERYAATKYMWERKIPAGIQELIIE